MVHFFSSIYIYSGTGKSGGGECIYIILSPSTVLYLVVAAHDTSHMLEEYIKGERVNRIEEWKAIKGKRKGQKNPYTTTYH